MRVLFKEEQKFTQWWVWVVIAVASIPVGVGAYRHFFVSAANENTMSDTGVIIEVVVISLILLLFLLLKLKTEIDQGEIRMVYVPFVRKSVKWTEVEEARVVNYGFVGGWGIRFWTSYGTVYNVSGNKGLALNLKDGKKFLIGTQKENELREVITHIQNPAT